MHYLKTSGAKPFSHIYIEKGVAYHPNTQAILQKINYNSLIYIDDYSQIFNRHHQDFIAQKRSPNLILARKKQDFYYDGSPYCENFGHARFYYTGIIMNCLYDCSYCYLKSIYPSGHMVIFVNNEDFITSVEQDLLSSCEPLYLAISYDSDLMALDPLTNFLSPWLALAERHANLTIEIKTKSGQFSIENPPQNVIFAWSLLPNLVIHHYERHTPSLATRMAAISQALNTRATVRFSIEPVMPIHNSMSIYHDFIDCLGKHFDLNQLLDINVGGFRISGKQFKTFCKKDPTCPVFAWPLTESTSGIGYAGSESLIRQIERDLKSFVKPEKIIVYQAAP